MLVKIFVECDSPVMARMGVGENEIRENLGFLLNDKDKEIYVIDGKGFVVLDIAGKQIYWICVKSELQGKGVGSKLIVYCENRAKELGSDSLCLYTSEDGNLKAKYFFGKFGFKQAGPSKTYADGSKALYYKKKI